jgi:hypothetical protein
MKTLFLKLIPSRNRTARSPSASGGSKIQAKAAAISGSNQSRFRPPSLIDPPLPGRGGLGRPQGRPRLLPED